MGINYNPSKWENGKTVIKASHFEKIEKGITDIINYNNSIYIDEDKRKENEIKREEEHNKKIKEVDTLVDDLKSDYDSLEKIIIDENASANLQNQINNVNSQLAQKANLSYVNTKLNSLAEGSPKGVYSTLDELISSHPSGDANIYLVTEDGCWYYWNEDWLKGGVYQSTGISDGSVTLQSFENDLLSQIKSMGTEYILQSLTYIGTPWINIDTTNKLVIVTEDSNGMTTSYTRTTLEKDYSSGIKSGVTELYYGDFNTSSIMLYYNITEQKYFLQEYYKPVPEESIFIMAFRGSRKIYSTRPIDVTIDGNADPVLIERLDNALFKLMGGAKTLFNTSVFNCENLITWDIDLKEVKIPAYMEFMYRNIKVNTGAGDIIINYISDETFLALGYSTKTREFEVLGTSELLIRHDFVLYDIIRITNGKTRTLFTDDIFFKGLSDLKYINPYELGKNNKEYFIVNIEEGLRRKAVDSMNIIQQFENRPYLTKKIAYAHNMNNSNFYSDCIRFTRRDNVSVLKLTPNNSNYKFYWTVKCLVNNGASYATLQNYVSSPAGKTLTINVARYLCRAEKEYNANSIFIDFQIIKEDGSVFTKEEIDRVGIHVDVVKHADITSNYECLSNSIDTSQDVIKRSTGSSPRIMFKCPIYANSEQVIMYGLDNRVVTYNDDTIKISIGLHGYTENDVAVYDGNWQIGDEYNCVELYYYEHNVYTHMYQKYDSYPFDMINEIDHYYVNIGMSSSLGNSYTLDDIKAICQLFTIKYEVRDLTEIEKVDLLDNPEIKSRLVKEAMSTKDSIHIINEQIFRANTSSIDTCIIPAKAKGYIVEFRGKVEGNMGYIQFSSGVDKMSIAENKYRSYKMRFNKSDYKDTNISIGVTVPTGCTLFIKNLKVSPVYEEIALSNHNKSIYYLHRGYSSVYPENTLLAVEEACKRGCSIVEIDVFTSTDDKVLVCHDHTLGRTNKARPTKSFSDVTLFSYNSSNKLNIDSSIISEFEINDQVVITDNGTEITALVIGVDTVANTITINKSKLTGEVTYIKNERRYVASCTEEEFLQYEVGAYMNDIFEGELNATFEDYIKVVRKYDTALMLDVRTITENCFKNHIAPLLDKYNYWDKCYFMHLISYVDNYHQWAIDLNRKMVGAAILWSSGDSLTDEIRTFGETNHSNMIRKDVVTSGNALTKEHIDLAHSYGMRVHAFTINDIQTAQRLLRLGVDIIAGDYFSDDTSILW